MCDVMAKSAGDSGDGLGAQSAKRAGISQNTVGGRKIKSGKGQDVGQIFRGDFPEKIGHFVGRPEGKRGLMGATRHAVGLTHRNLQ